MLSSWRCTVVQHSGTYIDGGTLDEYYKFRTLENSFYAISNFVTMGSLRQFLKLLLQEDLLCNALGIQPQADFANQVPSEQQLNDFEVYVKEKCDEKVRHLWLSFMILFIITLDDKI